MGSSAKVVIVGNLDVARIGNLVIQAVNKADLHYKEQCCKEHQGIPFAAIQMGKDETDRLESTARIHSYSFGGYNIIFSFNGKNRNMFFFTDAAYDYQGYNPNKKDVYSFSIGTNNSAEIIDVIANALKDEGKVYYTYNDCNDEPLKSMPHNEVAKAHVFDMQVQELVDLVSTHQSVKALDIIKRLPSAHAAYALGFVISHKDTPESAKNWLMNALYNG